MELVEQLKKDGIGKGLCRMWQMKLKPGTDMKSLVGLFIKGIDFCIANDYPTLDFMRQNFKGHCEPYGAYVDDDVKVDNVPNVVMNGDCKALVLYDCYNVGNIYIRHGSVVELTAADNAFVTVDIFDNAKLYVATAGCKARVNVNVYGNAVVEKANECVGLKIRLTNKKTY